MRCLECTAQHKEKVWQLLAAESPLLAFQVVYLEGRSMHRKQERPRWADCYKGISLES